MPDQKRNTINSAVTAMIIAFILLLLSSFSDNSNKHYGPAQNTLCSGLRSDNAVMADAVPFPSSKKYAQPLSSKIHNGINVSLSSESKWDRNFILLQKNCLSIIPLNPARFYYHLFSNEAEELPAIG
jgi:hypothetical protein